VMQNGFLVERKEREAAKKEAVELRKKGFLGEDPDALYYEPKDVRIVEEKAVPSTSETKEKKQQVQKKPQKSAQKKPVQKKRNLFF